MYGGLIVSNDFADVGGFLYSAIQKEKKWLEQESLQVVEFRLLDPKHILEPGI